jgi:hypothetical protein
MSRLGAGAADFILTDPPCIVRYATARAATFANDHIGRASVRRLLTDA